MTTIIALAAWLTISGVENERWRDYKAMFLSPQEQAWAECREESPACEIAPEIESADRIAWVKARNEGTEATWLR